ATESRGDILQAFEMLLHEREGIEVADAIVESRRPLDVSEQQRDVLDADALARSDHLGPEEVAEGLGGEQTLAGQERQKLDRRLADLYARRQYRKHERPTSGGRILHLEGDHARRHAS